MWGGRSRVYWGRKEAEFRGIVVVFGWASIHEEHLKHLKHYVGLYSSLGWNSLVCHADFLSALHPDRAMSLAFAVLDELLEEIRLRRCPVVFAAFSGGLKACMYNVFQIIEGACGGYLNQDENRLIRECFCGHIYDSGPIDFTSDFGARFSLHPSILRMPGSSKLVSWVSKGVASSLDALYLTKFESQRAEYWQALYSSVDLGAPFLIVCSDNDDLAPYRKIHNFAQRLRDMGGDVQLVRFNGSPHAGHYKHHPIQYRVAVTNLLNKATSLYSQRIQRLGERTEDMNDEISELICDLQKAAVKSTRSLSRVATGPCDHFFLPSSAEHQNSRESSSSSLDEHKEQSAYPSSPPTICANSILGQVLFDACVPKNIEGWDVKFCASPNGRPFASAIRFGAKSIRRSRL